MPTKSFRPQLAWFTITTEEKDVYHTCWDCPDFEGILEKNLDVTLVKWAKQKKRSLCEQCIKVELFKECCRVYPCKSEISSLTKARIILL